ncbi:MAG: hypothetical protein K0R90_292 [Oscillospiraceae bacterium]|jgi:O6-methylguanine-DNA--protein-cysteine methyltransferase|nr:hypothetical protein [Oscillospiraceae bacterium]
MIKYAFYKCEFGYLKVGYTDTAVTFLKRIENVDDKDVHSDVSDWAFAQIREYLCGKRKNFDFPYELHGTEFQKKAWHALCDIP